MVCGKKGAAEAAPRFCLLPILGGRGGHVHGNKTVCRIPTQV
jgi:hypothetical protein